MNRDRYGIIGQIQNDGSVEGGDAAAWNGHWLYLNDGKDPNGSVIKDSKDYVEFFEVGFGAYVRHPKPEVTFNGFGAHYKNPWNGCISRDQLTGVLAALISGKQYMAMLRVVLHSMCWLMLFTYNNIINGRDPETARWKLPDPMGPDIWATMLRGFGMISWLFWPILCILDVHTLINATVHNHKEEDDVISFTAKYMISRDHIPTPTSWLASKVLNKAKLLADLKEYWCGWRDNCEFVDLYEEKLLK